MWVIIYKNYDIYYITQRQYSGHEWCPLECGSLTNNVGFLQKEKHNANLLINNCVNLFCFKYIPNWYPEAKGSKGTYEELCKWRTDTGTVKDKWPDSAVNSSQDKNTNVQISKSWSYHMLKLVHVIWWLSFLLLYYNFFYKQAMSPQKAFTLCIINNLKHFKLSYHL